MSVWSSERYHTMKIKSAYSTPEKAAQWSQDKFLLLNVRHAVVPRVAHHFVLHLLPSEHGLLYEDLRAQRKRLRSHVDQVLPVVANAASEPAEGVRRTDHQRKADLLGRLEGLLQVVGGEALGGGLVDLLHLVVEGLAVLRIHHDLDRRAKHLHVMFVQNPFLEELHAHVERGLPAHRDDDGVRLLPNDNLLHELLGHWQEENLANKHD